jgi:hypothetical protein
MLYVLRPCTDQLYALCGRNVEILIIKTDGIYNNYWTL